jgi:hypothetical protein
MPDGLRTTLNLLLVPAVVAGLWALASLRNQRQVTYMATWLEDDGWHTGDPYAPPERTRRPIGFDTDPAPHAPAIPLVADLSDVDDDR